jgi:tRNA pseudouridine38-40 synthase
MSNDHEKYAYRLAYDGREYHGFQRQPAVQTVEGELSAALTELEVLLPEDDVPSDYAAAGRTDAGVSALQQTIGFSGPEWLTPRALNSALPDAIHVWARTEVPPDFHATHDAVRRRYVYHLFAPKSDLERAQSAARRLSGEHDRHNLTQDDAGTIREMTITVSQDGPLLLVECAADGFLHELVRRTASLIRAVALGAAPLERVDRVLSATPLSGPDGIAPAPPEPLVLTDVRYPNIEFELDADAVQRARHTMRTRAGAARSQSGVLDRIAAGLEREEF